MSKEKIITQLISSIVILFNFITLEPACSQQKNLEDRCIKVSEKEFTKVYRLPIDERYSCEQRKKMFYFQMEEFFDLSKEFIEADLDGDGILESVKEPEEHVIEKWNSTINPEFKNSNEIDPRVLEKKFEYGRDDITYFRLQNPKNIFKFLKDYNGEKVDRIIISAHGNEVSFGQKKPSENYVSIDDIRNYSSRDFLNIIKEDGDILLQSCLANYRWKENYTIAEFVSDLFQRQVTAPSLSSFDIYSGLFPEVSMNEDGEYILNYNKGNCILEIFGDYVTVYPNGNE